MVRRFGQPMDASDEEEMTLTRVSHWCADCNNYYPTTEPDCPVCRSVQQRESAARGRRALRIMTSQVARAQEEGQRQAMSWMMGYVQQMEEESAARRQQEEQQEEEQQEEQEYQEEEVQEEQEYQEEEEQQEAHVLDPPFEVTEVEADVTEEEEPEVDVQDPAFDTLFQESLAAAEEDEQRMNINFAAAEMSRLQQQTGGLAGADAGENGDLEYEDDGQQEEHEDDGALVEENLNKISNPPF